jgi:hypothetical protein
MRGTVAMERRVADVNPALADSRRPSVNLQGRVANAKQRFVQEK